ncbi:hypothetical protein MPH_13186 [Macrophomina phaseolina MS6]|uniref:Uncharacterized protein n=1 Tax=Macrophomina phaseolina (strain MS6) TaxID=1126212 RepID=K2R6D3_MACPH|nr:hypothetical protein MPH_13186 [Macrophomina phaseolina MS6]
MPASADYYSIYEGIWINWSRGRILGSTITLNRRDGGLLISFIALFVTFVGTASWRIICFALHHHLSSEAPRDALYHQQQAVLRNSANGSSGLCSLSHILWTWRHYKSHHPFRRMLPTIILTVIFLGSFAVAGVFSSKIATSTGTEVLVSSRYCGVLNTTGVDLVSMAMIMKPYFVQSTTDAVNYGQNCYTNTSNSQECRTYVKKQLPWTSNRNASCPFPREMCKNDHSNLELDTGFIDSSDHLGMNGPPEKRVILRSVQRCAPLAIEPFVNKTSVRRDDLEANLTRVYLGPTMYADASDDHTLGHWDYSNPNDTSPDGTGFTGDYKIR